MPEPRQAGNTYYSHTLFVQTWFYVYFTGFLFVTDGWRRYYFDRNMQKKCVRLRRTHYSINKQNF